MTSQSDFNEQLRRLRTSIQGERVGRQDARSRAESEHHVGWIALLRDARKLTEEVKTHPAFHYFRVARNLQEFSVGWRATARQPKRLTVVYKRHPDGKQHPDDHCYWYSHNGVDLERLGGYDAVMERLVRVCALYTAD